MSGGVWYPSGRFLPEFQDFIFSDYCYKKVCRFRISKLKNRYFDEINTTQILHFIKSNTTDENEQICFIPQHSILCIPNTIYISFQDGFEAYKCNIEIKYVTKILSFVFHGASVIIQNWWRKQRYPLHIQLYLQNWLFLPDCYDGSTGINCFIWKKIDKKNQLI